MSTLIVAIILAIVGVLTGWLAPMVVKSRRPYGVEGDIAVSVAIMVVVGLIEWLWILPLFDFADWINWLAVIGDPIVLALIALWLMRKLTPEAVPAEPEAPAAADGAGADDAPDASA